MDTQPKPIQVRTAALSQIDVPQLTTALQQLSLLLPKQWFRSSIIILSALNVGQLMLGAFTPLIPAPTAAVIGIVISVATGVLRYVNPNPPIAGSPQDPAKAIGA